MRRIKVLFRHRSMEMGGVEKVLLSIINNLNPKKFDVTVLLSLNQGELRDEFPKHVRKVYLTKGKEDFSENKIIQKIQLFRRRIQLRKLNKNPEHIDKKILKDSYDIEIAMDYRDFEMVLNSSNTRSKKIAWFHSEVNVPKFKPLLPLVINNFPKFDHIVYCSRKIKDLIHKEYPELEYPNESVITNAINIDEIRKKANEKITDFPIAKPIFISVGRLHTRKGYHKLMQAHKILLNEGLKHTIVILGNGEEKANLLAQRKRLGVEDSFLLLGNKMNPYSYINQADYFVLPSESEAWPLVVAESLILKKTIVATDTGDVGLMINNGETGLLCEYNVESLYNGMKTVLEDKTLVTHIQNNLENIDAQFDNQKIFNAIETLFQEIITL